MSSASTRGHEDRVPARGRTRRDPGAHRGEGANLQAVGELQVEKILHTVMALAIGDRRIVPAAICLGIAGVDRPNDAAVVRSIMQRIGLNSRIVIVNDALIALETGAPGLPGG